MNTESITSHLQNLFKDAKCELNYESDWQLLIAILLSAQCTDKKVNAITPILFKRYPNLESLKQASFYELEKIIHPLGLSNTKAKNIIQIATILNEKHHNKVPSDKKELTKLPGIGGKTANVMLIEYFNIPAFPVDTHVSRVSKRLNLCKETDTVEQIENKLMKKFPKKIWGILHIRMVLFGRYICKAIKPNCTNCPFNGNCKLTKKV